MIEKIMNKLGYAKIYRDLEKQPYTEEEIYKMFTEMIGDVSDYSFPKKEELIMFDNLSAVDGFKDYLKFTIAKDIQRFFSAQDNKTRDIITGATARISFLLSMMKGKQETKTTKLGSLRYGK